MYFDCFVCPPIDTNAYLIACSQTKEAAVIDPGTGVRTLVKKKLTEDNLHLKYIFLTHSHWDHIAGAAEIQEEFEATLWVHPEDAPNVEDPGSDKLPTILPIEKAKVDHYFADGMKLNLGTLEIEIIHTPGHSPGSVCLYFPKEKMLFSGDTLFQGTIGNISFPTSSSEDMWQSLKKIEKLPTDTEIFPGHGPKTILSDEKWITKAKELFG